MGAVWLARDEVLGRDVAIKRIGMMPGGTSPDLDRAEREARLAARLNHPHVVAVFDLTSEGDERWLVMEYIDGVTLAELARREGALSPDRAAPLLAQAADALAAAHAAGIIHRDVKPSNILVTADGQVKLSDFGIARAEADASLTQTGLVTGSPAYLAPEVASGATATDASDVWSLGATLYHSLAARPPYEVGENLMGALYRIVHEEPPRLEDAGWLSPLLEATMTKDPDQRWSMAQVRDFLASGPGAAPPPEPAPVATEPEATQLMAPPPPAPSGTRTAEHSLPPAEDAPPGAHGRRATAPVLVALAVLALLGVIAWAVLSGDEPPAATSPGPEGSSSSDNSSSTTKDAEEPPDPTQPTAGGMEDFVDAYLSTAASDPETAYTMLTPEFQRQSGGLEGYLGFWNEVETASLESVTADPESLQVSYEVAYTMASEEEPRSPEQVSLTLIYRNGGYKIAAES